MDEKKSAAQKLEAFFAGKGFYMVLMVCLAVIGLSAWTLLSQTGGAAEPGDAAAVSGLVPEPFPVLDAWTPAPVREAPAPTQEDPEEPEETETAAAEPEPEPEEAAQSAAEEPPEETRPAGAEERNFFVWPVNGTLERDYAMDALRYDPTMLDWRTHDGLDLAAAMGTPVRAAGDGHVARVYEDERYGTTVVITHANGLSSLYANLAALPTVSAGDLVTVGQVIGSVGDTAPCEIGEAAHLHFAMYREGVSVNPADYLPG
ncbi:MAG: M23 family metallopeptidase [Oscillospiraceae bacterium]|nr:M23 family metallopeptidase [Oscillospiraceae bacterium]